MPVVVVVELRLAVANDDVVSMRRLFARGRIYLFFIAVIVYWLINFLPFLMTMPR